MDCAHCEMAELANPLTDEQLEAIDDFTNNFLIPYLDECLRLWPE